MPEETNNGEQYNDFLDSLPPEIKNAILSEDNAILIAGICLENGVEDKNKIEKIAYQATMLLLGEISREEFPLFIEKELQIDGAVAKQISDEIDEFFISQSARQDTKELSQESPIRKNEAVIEKKPKPLNNDAYQEPIE
jgi:hypothetical protein